jgi:hypothetical protein
MPGEWKAQGMSCNCQHNQHGLEAALKCAVVRATPYMHALLCVIMHIMHLYRHQHQSVATHLESSTRLHSMALQVRL